MGEQSRKERIVKIVFWDHMSLYNAYPYQAETASKCKLFAFGKVVKEEDNWILIHTYGREEPLGTNPLEHYVWVFKPAIVEIKEFP